MREVLYMRFYIPFGSLLLIIGFIYSFTICIIFPIIILIIIGIYVAFFGTIFYLMERDKKKTEQMLMKRRISNYCLNCHDNTTWTQFSFPNEIRNYNDSGNTAVFITYSCDKCGKKNTYYHMK